MAHKAADGSMWSNAAQARKVPGKAQGDGKQPVSKFPTSDAPRDPAAGVSASPAPDPTGPQVEVSHDGNMFTVTAKFASEDEAHAAASALSGSSDQDQEPAGNPAQSMM